MVLADNFTESFWQPMFARQLQPVSHVLDDSLGAHARRKFLMGRRSADILGDKPGSLSLPMS